MLVSIREGESKMNCPKCDGNGYIKEYAHISAGVCFHCGGKGFVGSNGRAIKDIQLKHIHKSLPGLNKRQTKEVFSMAYTSCIYNCVEEVKDFDVIVNAGYWLKTQTGKTIRYERNMEAALNWDYVNFGA
jgi:RecJ-like exonuclease